MGKGSGGWRSEGGEGVGPNRLIEGDSCWNGGGGVGDASRREDGWGDKDELDKSSG